MLTERLAPEQHDTLEGVPEPRENPLLVGHSDEAAQIARAYRAGKLPHAIILSGPRGIGKATLAFRIAGHLLHHPDAGTAPDMLTPPEPDQPLFRQIAQASHPGIMHLTRPLNEKTKGFRAAVTVDEIRRVQRLLGLTAHDGGYRIVIVDPADDLNANAANALLKSLEEPPPRCLFILVSHASGRLLPTIRSRCQRLNLAPLTPGELSTVLESVAPGERIDADALVRAGGSARDALIMAREGGAEICSTTEHLVALATPDRETALKLAEAVSSRDRNELFNIWHEFVLDLISNRASAAAQAGELVEGETLAELWQEVRAATVDVLAYNLDKRQHVYATTEKVRAAFSVRRSRA